MFFVILSRPSLYGSDFQASDSALTNLDSPEKLAHVILRMHLMALISITVQKMVLYVWLPWSACSEFVRYISPVKMHYWSCSQRFLFFSVYFYSSFLVCIQVRPADTDLSDCYKLWRFAHFDFWFLQLGPVDCNAKFHLFPRRLRSRSVNENKEDELRCRNKNAVSYTQCATRTTIATQRSLRHLVLHCTGDCVFSL